MLDATRLTEQNRRLFNWLARWYDLAVPIQIFFQPVYRQTIEVIRREAGLILRRGGRIVDVACGTGEVIVRLAREFPAAEFIGIDFAPAMLQKAREKARALTQARFIEAPAAAIPLPASSADAVLCSDAFHHLAEPQAVIAEIHRVLKPGGLFLLVDPAFNSRLARWLGNLVKGFEHAYHYYSLTELKTLLTAPGFTITAGFRYRWNNYVLAKKS
ncbi:MAG: class I SAM-dependent methyltransferase [Candidatus Magasanikbacteria bacterium]|nr:class I SAM-dependent methyltransferase [Candidatus Magasanikbacteria bacterium]